MSYKPVTGDRRTRPFRHSPAIRAQILAMAKPGELLPPLREISALTGRSKSSAARHVDQLRDEWKLVTRPTSIPKTGQSGWGSRLLVVAVNP